MDQDSLRVAKTVQDLLSMDIYACKARVLADEVEQHTSGVWYVPISVHRDTEHMGLIYEKFSDIEEKLESTGDHVLLVPRIVPFERQQDVA